MSCGCGNFPNCECHKLPHCGGTNFQHSGHSGRTNRSSCNPCGNPATNTPTCENLPSQIDNFTKQFFGEVTKTEVDGIVSWSLPCSLDVGLENNPRLEGEGLACYFLRLFDNGILGLTGPKGDTGAAGTNGNNAYTVTLAGFVQPNSGAPNVQVSTLANPAIMAGLTIFIATSGYYFVNSTDGNGTLFLSLIQASAGAPAIITAGKLVIAAGPQGVSITGPQGPQGVPGPQGTAGASFTATNGQYAAVGGTDFPLPVTYTLVDFTSSVASVLLPQRGKYLLTTTVGVVGTATISPADQIAFRLMDTTLITVVPFSDQVISNVDDTEHTQVIINVIYETDSDSHTVQLFGQCTTGAAANAVANDTVITFVRLS